MRTVSKIGVVSGGYLLAVGASIVAAHLYNARMAAMPHDTSGGMYAAGEGLSALATFLGVAIAPTLLSLWYLRRNRTVWSVASVAAVAFAAVGFVAVLVTSLAPGSRDTLPLMLLELLALAQLLGVPLWTLAFALLAFLAPQPRIRHTLHVAIGVELVIGVLAAIHWLAPLARR